MPLRKKKLYSLNDGDKAIFARLARENNPNIFTGYYLKSQDSGTWWRPVFDWQIKRLTIPHFKKTALIWKEGYDKLLEIWKDLGEPDAFALYNDKTWGVFDESSFRNYEEMLDVLRIYRTTFHDGHPVFHHNHGIIQLPWQMEMWKSQHAVQVIIGGLGASKTYGKIVHMLVRAATLPGYRGFGLAPFSIQANEIFRVAKQIIEGTPYEERFLIASPTRPHPQLIIGNDYVGENVIEFLPIKDNSQKLLTLTGDEAMVDQAEQLDHLDSVIRDISTRFRGLIRGRPRRGQITLIANSADNPMLWDWYDEAESDSEHVWAYSPSTADNTYLVVQNLLNYQRIIGEDKHQQAMYIEGKRPLGHGEHFPAHVLDAIRSDWLDDFMKKGLESGNPGFVKKEAKKIGIYQWEIPPEDGKTYVVVADPGWANPPERNSPPVSVWDVTGFPEIPAHMVAFSWVFGNGSPNPWIQQFTDYVMKYQAVGKCAFDATGAQSGYERIDSMRQLLPMPVNMGGGKKYTLLTLTKKIMADGKYKVPYIPMLFSQLVKYKLPDEKVRQDIVMMLLVLTAWVERLWYIGFDDSTEGDNDTVYEPEDRYKRVISNRYGSLRSY